MNLKGATVLIVDDNPTNLSVLVDCLNETDFKILVAQNGEDAIERAVHTNPEAILLDVMMPGIDGFETCRRLKQNDAVKDIPVIFMTALSDYRDIVNGFACGAADYICKPFQYEEVLARLTTQISLSRHCKQLEEANARLEVASHTDDVTGFYNTRYLHKFIDDFLENSHHPLKELSIIFFDIDDFKKVVDTHGHLVGSKLLRKVAWEVHRELDPSDRIVRYGGDEFVVILPDQSKDVAYKKAKEMKQTIKSKVFLQEEGLTIKMTASFGLSTYPENAVNKRQLLSEADRCLFKSKENGKDRLTLN